MAIAIATVLVVSVLVVLTQLMAGSQKSNDLASGSIVAERVLTEVVSRPTITPGNWEGISTSTLSAEASQEYHYAVDIRPLDITEPEAGKSYLVTVDVWWMTQQPDQTRAGVGKLAVKTSRIVYRSEAASQP